MALFKIFKGLENDLSAGKPNTNEGYCYFTTDTGKMYIDILDGTNTANDTSYRVCLNAEQADFANKLKTARRLTIGQTGKNFDGSADVSWNSNEIGYLDLVGRGIQIADNSDLNNLGYGNYFVNSAKNAETIANAPLASAGFRIMSQKGYNSSNTNYAWQFATTSTRKIYQRHKGTEDWSNWGNIVLTSTTSGAGSSTEPVYINGSGVATACGSSLAVSITGNAATATKLATARTIRTNLASTSTASFNGSGNITPGVTGTLPAANGGTGETTLQNACNSLINALGTGSSTPSDADYYVSQYAGGGTTTTTYHRRPVSALWSYMKGKADSVYAAKSHTHSYLPLSGGTLSGSIHIAHTTNATMDNTTTNPRISFSESGTQEVALVYTDYNNYRSPAGLKVIGIGTDASPAWFEAEGNIYGSKIYGAVWNDYAEYRNQEKEIKAGYCVASTNDGKVYKTTEKFQACDGIVSDTFGFAIGETNECKTPLAVAGRVLAYCEGDRYSYHAGDTVCAGPDGKVVKMTREEIREWPDRIVGIVSEIPEYETWGSGNIPVDGRVWIKIK